MNRFCFCAWITLITLASSWLPSNAADNSKPNLVVILVDDMGYGDPGCFNPESKIPTPHIDKLAREGMRFTDAHASGPLCHVSRYGLITGRYPFRADVGSWRKRPVIEHGQTTIASLAKSNGYRTAMVGKWHLGFDEGGYEKPLPGGPIDCGFDSFYGIRASTDIPPYFYIRGDRAVKPPSLRIEANRSDGWSPIQGAFWRAGGIAPDLKLDEVLPRFTNEALRVIEQHAENDRDERPLMLYLAYPAPHTPWLPSQKFVGKSGAGMYGDFLMMVDAEIGRVLAALRKAGMEKSTLVVFSSDNGPVWYEADTRRLGHDSSGGLRGMKSDAWEAGHRMPFIVRWPERVKAGTESAQLLCFTDLLATFAEVMGGALPADAGPDSFSFLPALTGRAPKATSVRTQCVMQAGSVPSMMMIRSGNWKLITGLGSGGFSRPNRVKAKPGDPPGQLYNLVDDLSETKNLCSSHPAVVARLTAELKKIVDDGQSRTRTASVDTDPGSRRKSLGGKLRQNERPADEPSSQRPKPAKKSRRNVLFIVCDDLNTHVSTSGYAHIKTPSFDRLAAEGMTFRRAYCQYPVCGPSRASFLHGLYPQSTGVLDNRSDIRDTRPGTISMPQLFKEAGYWTGAVGKVFHNVKNDPGDVAWHRMKRFDNDEMPFVKKFREKFEAEHGAVTAGKARRKWRKLYPTIAKQTRGQQPGYGPSGLKDRQHKDGKNARQIAKWLLEKAHGDKPFFMACGIQKPHVPFLAPDKYFEIYPQANLKFEPASIAFWKQAPKLAQTKRYRGFGFEFGVANDTLRREYIQAYHACISFIDAQIGIVFDALIRSGHWDDTIVVLTSDHGYMLGEKFMWGKVMLFEDCDRVPLIIRVPGRTKPGSSSEGLVELVDLFPTLAELC
ncbi:MAG: sulfatase-like hydrolase/transferase, partial [Deltaproteobacteria bacterium]|nr:sulfatase-like hydrolase/transferase [Deltaproteobacteria bacterium]